MKKILKQSEAIETYYSKYYLDEHKKYFTKKRTNSEVDFLIDHLYKMPQSVCDVACGNGRHLAQFRKLGVNHGLGIDPNQTLLSLAEDNLEHDPSFKLLKADFNSWQPVVKFDIVYTLFSSTCYCIEDRQVQELINKMFTATAENGIIVIDTENVFPMVGYMDVEYSDYNRTLRFNPETMTIESSQNVGDAILETSRRYYIATELKYFLEKSGIKKENIQIFGDFDNTRYSLSSDRLIVVATKTN